MFNHDFRELTRAKIPNQMLSFLHPLDNQTTDDFFQGLGIIGKDRDMTRYATRLFVFLVLIFFLPAGQAALARGKESERRILVLYAYNYSQAAQKIIAEGLETARMSAGLGPDVFVHEYLDISPPKNQDHRIMLKQLLLGKYEGVRFDLLVTVFDDALTFLLEDVKDLSPDSPCLALYNQERHGLARGGRPVLQSPLYVDPRGTLDLALKLFPQTRTVVFIAGNSPLDRNIETKARSDFAAYGHRLNIEYTGGMSADRILERIRSLKTGEVVIYGRVSSDATGRKINARDMAFKLASEAMVPVFCLATSHLDTGVVGGSMVRVEELAVMLGRFLPGLMDHRPVVLEPASRFVRPMFEWNQLRRWGIGLRDLPGDSVVVNRPKTLWSQYKTEVVATGLAFLLLVFFILALAVQGSRRKAAEIRAKENESRYRLLIEQAPDAIVVYDVDLKRFVEANESAVKLFGCTRDVLLKSGPLDFSTGDQAARADGYLRQVLDGASLHLEWNLRTADRQTLVCDMRLVRLPSARKRLIRASLIDITGRKQAEEELKLFRDLVGHSTDAIGMSTPQGRHEYQNATFDRLFGDVGDSPPDRLYVDRTVGKAVFDTIMAGESWMGEVKMFKQDRTPVDIFLRAYPIRNSDGRIIGLVGIHTDITSQKQAEKELEDWIRRYELIVAASGQVAYEYQMANGRITWGKSIEQVLGYQADEIRGGFDQWVELLHPEDKDSTLASLQAAEEECAYWEAIYRMKHKNGHQVWIKDRGFFVPDMAGKAWCQLGMLEDITEARNTGEEKIRLQEQLHQSQKMEYVGRLAGGVAHDFNNMLGVILGHLDMLMEEMDPGGSVFAELTEIRKAAERSAELTRQLLAFARKQVASPRVLDLNETVEGLMKMLRRLIGEDVDLSWNPGNRLPLVKIDPSQVDQLLVNLCLNARQAIDGVGRISIKTTEASFDDEFVRLHPDHAPGRYVVVEVEDSGCGMDKETLDRIFEPFFTTKDVGQGTGLGLATVYGIMKQNQGFITVYSEPGMGALFRFYLPAWTGGGEVMTLEPSPDDTPRPGHETILLVEDEPAILDMIRKMLERDGYTVLAANRPDHAIRLAEEHPCPIDLLMTDVIMPAMNGRDLAAAMLAFAPGLRCLFMSGYTADVIGHHGVLEKGVHFIQKPFSRKELNLKLRELFDKKD